MKKRNLLLVLVVMMFTLAACSSGNSSNNAESSGDPSADSSVKKVSDISGTVRVALAGYQLENGIDPLTGGNSIGLNQFLNDTFKKMYPNIKLEISQVPWENAKAKQYSMLLSNDVDVLYTGGGFATQWYQEGLLRDIDELVAVDKSFDSSIYLDGVWNNYSTKSLDKEHQIGIPVILGRRMTMYDKKLFDDWGVAPLPETATVDDILDAALKMTGKNPKTGEQNYGLFLYGNSTNGSTFVALTLAFGAKGAEGSLSDLKNIKWELNSPEMVKVFEWLKKAAPLAPPAFVNGQGAENFGLDKNIIAIGLDQSGNSTMSEFQNSKNTALLDRFVTAMNIGPKGESWVAVDPFVMAKKAQDVQASWEVMKFLSGYEAQKYNYKYFAKTPTLKNPDFLIPEDKYVKEAIKIADIGHSELMDLANPFFLSEIIPAVNGFISMAAKGNAPDIQTYLDNMQKRAVNWSNNLK